MFLQLEVSHLKCNPLSLQVSPGPVHLYLETEAQGTCTMLTAWLVSANGVDNKVLCLSSGRILSSSNAHEIVARYLTALVLEK